jgi:hypothetical protein
MSFALDLIIIRVHKQIQVVLNEDEEYRVKFKTCTQRLLICRYIGIFYLIRPALSSCQIFSHLTNILCSFVSPVSRFESKERNAFFFVR